MTNRVRWSICAAACALLSVAVGVKALGSGQSFNAFLAPGYQQELYGVTNLGVDPGDDSLARTILGGVAFAPDGDVWSAECRFGVTSDGTGGLVIDGTVLHRFDAQTQGTFNGTSTLHPETTVPTMGGCGLTNHYDHFIYSNSALGIFRIDASTGAIANWFDGTNTAHGPAGNALGITADPVNHHIVYAGAGCHPGMPGGIGASTPCRIVDLNPSTGVSTTFAEVGPATTVFIDGIYFEPTGTFLFVANRDPFGTANFLTVLRRPEASIPFTADPQLVQSIATSNEPDGVAFHAASPKFVVTNDEDGDTMTAFTFGADNYANPPTITTFAEGGFRGDLVNVGIDGCLYATQGRHGGANDFGTRYDDTTMTSEDSIVRICATTGGGFAPGPGVVETVTDAGGPSPLMLSCPLGTGQVGVPYSSKLLVSGGKQPYTYSVIAGSLPNGLTLNTATGAITGTPTAAGPFTFTWQVIDDSGQVGTDTASHECTITIAPAPLGLNCVTGGGQVGTPYNASLVATGGMPPYGYSIISGALPPGVTLNQTTGVLSGTPTTAGPYTFTAQATDSSGNSATNTVTSSCNSITVTAPPPPFCVPADSAFNLGAAAQFTVLFMNGSKAVTGGSSVINGNVGLGANNTGSLIKLKVNGNLYTAPGANLSVFDSNFTVSGQKFTNSPVVPQAITDALAANASLNALANTQAGLGSIGDAGATINLAPGLNVIPISAVNTHGVIKINGPANSAVVFKVAGGFTCNGCTISGNVPAQNILWNFAGTGGDVDIIKPVGLTKGIFLAPDRNISLDKATNTGALIGARNGLELLIHSAATENSPCR